MKNLVHSKIDSFSVKEIMCIFGYVFEFSDSNNYVFKHSGVGESIEISVNEIDLITLLKIIKGDLTIIKNGIKV